MGVVVHGCRAWYYEHVGVGVHGSEPGIMNMWVWLSMGAEPDIVNMWVWLSMGVEPELRTKSCRCYLVSQGQPAWLHETKCRPCVCGLDVQYVVLQFLFQFRSPYM